MNRSRARTIMSLTPMERFERNYSWAKHYEDFDDNAKKYEKVFQIIEEKTFVKHNIYYLTFIQKVALYSRNRFFFTIEDVNKIFLEENERDMRSAETNMLRFTLMYVTSLKEAYDNDELLHYPIYVFEQVAGAIIDVIPGFFEGLNVNIIENTW